MRRLVAAVGLVITVTVGALGFADAASAAPIVCPNGQTAQKTADGWQCVNGGNNGTGAGWHQGNHNKL